MSKQTWFPEILPGNYLIKALIKTLHLYIIITILSRVRSILGSFSETFDDVELLNTRQLPYLSCYCGDFEMIEDGEVSGIFSLCLRLF